MTLQTKSEVKTEAKAVKMEMLPNPATSDQAATTDPDATAAPEDVAAGNVHRLQEELHSIKQVRLHYSHHRCLHHRYSGRGMQSSSEVGGSGAAEGGENGDGLKLIELESRIFELEKSLEREKVQLSAAKTFQDMFRRFEEAHRDFCLLKVMS